MELLDLFINNKSQHRFLFMIVIHKQSNFVNNFIDNWFQDRKILCRKIIKKYLIQVKVAIEQKQQLKN